MRAGWIVMVLIAGSWGCLYAPVYRTAKTIPAGKRDVGIAVKAVRYAFTERYDDGSGTIRTRTSAVTIPDLTPEVMAHLGVTDNFEVGGRLALSNMMAEVDGTLRLTPRESPLSLAVQASLGYQALLIIEGMHATFPLILTYDVGEGQAINLAPFVQFQRFYNTGWGDDSDLNSFAHRSMLVGGSVGFEFPLGLAHVMPSLSYARVVTRYDRLSDTAGTTFANDSFVLNVAFGRVL